jgi:hypothetical protein
MCYCDVEPAACWHERWPKARKPHWCCECGAPIAVGDIYHHFSGVWDGRGGDYRTCLECSQVRDHYKRECWRQRECAPAFSQLYDYWERDQLPPHVVESFNRLRQQRIAA